MEVVRGDVRELTGVSASATRTSSNPTDQDTGITGPGATPPDIIPRCFIQPQVFTILGTYRCTAQCENCCVDSNPWIQQRLTLERILAFIDEARRFASVELIAFSGGECFLLGPDLAVAVAHASRSGFRTRCVTNGYWAKSVNHGRTRLSALRDAGLDELNISTGDYHQKWVPQQSVVNAALIAAELAIDNIVICVETQAERRVSAASLLETPELAALATRLPRDKFLVIESPWMPMDATKVIHQDASKFLNRDNVHTRGGCDSIFSTVVLNPQDRIGICCGLSRELIPELNFDGDKDLAEILAEAAEDFLKIWLYVDGPEKILSWAASVDPAIAWENRYAHRCHACLALYKDPQVRRVIRENYRSRVDDVLLRYSYRLRRQELDVGKVYA